MCPRERQVAVDGRLHPARHDVDRPRRHATAEVSLCVGLEQHPQGRADHAPPTGTPAACEALRQIGLHVRLAGARRHCQLVRHEIGREPEPFAQVLRDRAPSVPLTNELLRQ